jgi:hypothetical protein
MALVKRHNGHIVTSLRLFRSYARDRQRRAARGCLQRRYDMQDFHYETE